MTDAAGSSAKAAAPPRASRSAPTGTAADGRPSAPGSALPFLLLGATSVLVDGIQEGMRARGFTDLRPAHGFAFARIATGDSTIGDLAGYLGMTKQAASQLVDELAAKGYVERQGDARDARIRLVRLTDRGRACTRALEEAAADMLGRWQLLLGDDRLDALRDDLARLGHGGRLRPAW